MSGKKSTRGKAVRARASTKAKPAAAKLRKSKQEATSDDSASDSDTRSDVELLDAEFEDEAADDADEVDVDVDVDADEDEDDDVDEDEDDEDEDEEDEDVDEDAIADTKKRISEFDFIYSKSADTPSREIIVVKNEDRITSHMLSKTEITEAVSIRCAQIQKNPVVFVDIDGITDPIVMAKKEINERKCPLVLRRFIGRYKSNDYYEYWDINEMTRPFIYEL